MFRRFLEHECKCPYCKCTFILRTDQRFTSDIVYKNYILPICMHGRECRLEVAVEKKA